MTRHTKKILDRYRQAESLDLDARARVMRTLERRIANGESSLLGINVDPPTLPITHSVLSFAAGKVAVKVGVAIALTAASGALIWRGWESQRAAQRASTAPIAAPAVSSRPSPPKAAQQRPVTAEKTERPPQPLTTQEPLTAVERGDGKQPLPKPVTKLNSRYLAGAPQPAANSPPEGTVTIAVMPRATDRFDSVVSEPTSRSRRTLNKQIEPDEENRATIEPESKTDPTRSDPVASPPVHQDTKSSIDGEMKLLRAAHAALRAGKPERALVELAEHVWRFPNGKLAESRDVTRIMALCRAGEVEIARSEAKRFVAERPSSPFVGRVLATCRDRTKTSP